MDGTTAPVLDPGRSRINGRHWSKDNGEDGYLWAMLRDDRGWGRPLGNAESW
jgi:hypothetical protein